MNLRQFTWVLLCSSVMLACDQDTSEEGVVIIVNEPGRDIVLDEPVGDERTQTQEPGNSIPFIETDNAGQATNPSDASACSGTEQIACEDQCGLRTCQFGQWSECAAGVERCNDHDDDCDGSTDESLGVGMNCTNRQDDDCVATGILVCDTETQSVVCDAQPTGPMAETCDGLDNDCDGVPDEDFPNQRCCSEDYQCPPSASCVNNQCVGGGSPGGGTGPGFGSGDGSCQSLLDCALGLTCADGRCVPMCFTHEDCQPGQRCGCPAQDPGCLLMACLDGPPGDVAGRSCENSTVIDGLGQYRASNANAANDLSATCGNRGSGPEAVFTVRFDMGQDVVIDTIGSDFDTVLAIRTQCAELATEVACDDDGAGATRSRLTLRAQAGQDYYLVVHGYDQNSRGNIILNVSAQGAGIPDGNMGGGGGLCDDSCAFANDGACDDGGPNSAFSVCDLGTDCTDCGPR